MIELNLLPPSQRKKKKKKGFGDGVKIPLEIVIGSAGGLLFLLVIVHFIFLFVNMSKLAQHNILKSEWERLVPAREKIDTVKNEMRSMQSKLKAIGKITGEDRIIWSKKLNIISDSVPVGVWFKKIVLSEDALFIEGSAISKSMQQMISVHEFNSALKKSKDFLKDFTEVELGSIQSRMINKTALDDFILTIKMKE